MSEREQADLVLPTATEIQEYDRKGSPGPTTTVNIQHRPAISCPAFSEGGYCQESGHWAFVIRGREVPRAQLRERLKAEADEALEQDVNPDAGVRLSARRLIIRADRAAPYGFVNAVLETCGLVGIYRIEVGAAFPTPSDAERLDGDVPAPPRLGFE